MRTYVKSKNRLEYMTRKAIRYINRYTKLEIISVIMAAIIIFWFGLSFIDIAANNMNSKIYSDWNVIVKLAKQF